MRRSVVVLLIGACMLAAAGCRSSEDARTTENRQTELEDLRSENARLRNQLAALRKQVRSGVMRRGETVDVLSADVFFESGSAELAPEGLDRLKEVGTRLQHAYAGRTIRIEGYTDSNPIRGRLKETYPSNWELSAARAASVARHLQWTYDIAPERLEVVGYGPYQPIASNDTEEGRRMNRRVRIAVLPPNKEKVQATNSQP